MADEKTPPAEGDELILTPEDQVPGDEQPTNEDAEPSPPSIDDLASEMGWVPKDQFQGDPERWKPAVQFIRDGKDIQRQQSRDLKDLRGTMDNIARTNAQILADRIEQEKERLSQRYAKAVDDGEVEESFKIAQKINGLDQQAQPKNGVSTETQEWVGKNPWMNTDPLAARLAVTVCNDLAHLPVSQQLESAEREVRRVYPHLFGTQKPPPGVNQPDSRSTNKAKGPKTAADLPREALKVAQDMVERGVIPNVDIYAKNYWATEGQAQ